MKYAIDETELARLVAKACRRPKPTTFDELRNAVPALVAEVRRLREEAKQGGIDYCALMDRHDAQFVRAEDLKKQVEDLQWFVECFDNCKQRGKLPLEVHKTPSAYSEAWASLWAAREAVHADR